MLLSLDMVNEIRELLIMNIYLPYDYPENSNAFLFYVSNTDSIISDYESLYARYVLLILC